MGWRIEGSDLLFTSLRRSTPLPARELADTAYHLVTLARAFPADLAARYGATPASTTSAE